MTVEFAQLRRRGSVSVQEPDEARSRVEDFRVTVEAAQLPPVLWDRLLRVRQELQRDADAARGAHGSASVRLLGADGPSGSQGKVKVAFVDTAAAASAEASSAATESRMVIVAHVVSAEALRAGADGGQGHERRRVNADVTVEVQGQGVGTGRALVRLRHPQLGPVEIEVGIDGVSVDLRLRVRSKRKAQVLAAAADGLRTTLQAQGLTVGQLRVDADRAVVRSGDGAADFRRPRRHQLEVEV